MSEMKMMFCCGSAEDLCQGISCKVEETDQGFTFSVTSDDPGKIEKLKSMAKSCCSSDKDEKSSGGCC